MKNSITKWNKNVQGRVNATLDQVIIIKEEANMSEERKFELENTLKGL